MAKSGNDPKEFAENRKSKMKLAEGDWPKLEV